MHRSILHPWLLGIALVFAALQSIPFASATSIAPPTDKTIRSRNGSFLLKVDAKSGDHSIVSSRKPNVILWKFTHTVWHDDYFLSNDGATVAWISWPYVKVDDIAMPALILFTKGGKNTVLTYKAAESLRRPSKNAPAPIGDFWRIWRDGISRDKEILTIHLSQHHKIRINLNTGAISKLSH